MTDTRTDAEKAEQAKKDADAKAAATATVATPPTGPAQPVVVDGRPLAPAAEAQQTQAYKLRAGMSHGHGGKALAVGEEVQLTIHQAEAFADKFEPVDATPKETEQDELKRLRAENATLRGLVGTVAVPSPNIRQDIGANTPMGKETVLSDFDVNKLPQSGLKDKANAVGGEEPLQPAGSVGKSPANPASPAAPGAGGSTPQGGSTDNIGVQKPGEAQKK